MSLSTKYRPSTIEKVIGNIAVRDAIKELTQRTERPHTWLFCGPYGTGKTTLGRIVAGMLGAAPEDIYELNIGDLRGIDEARNVLLDAQYAPLHGTAKAYIFDEAHRMTADAQACMLKTLEEPPAHAYFILCTNDASRLTKALRSRCVAFETSLLAERELSVLLKQVRQAEGYTHVPDTVVSAIAKSAEGTPRTALAMLEQVAALKEEALMMRLLRGYITENMPEVVELCRMLMNDSEWPSIGAHIKALKEEHEAEAIRKMVCGYMAAVLMKAPNVLAYYALDAFKAPFYDGYPALVRACYELYVAKKGL